MLRRLIKFYFEMAPFGLKTISVSSSVRSAQARLFAVIVCLGAWTISPVTALAWTPPPHAGEGVSSEIFPAGTRLSIASGGGEEVHLVIAASGPALFWVQALSPEIRLLRIGNKEVSATAVAMNGMAECAIPVYAAGPVDVTLLSAPSSSGGRILITSFYGMGDPVTAPVARAAALVSRVESAMEELQMIPVPPPPAAANVQVALPTSINALSDHETGIASDGRVPEIANATQPSEPVQPPLPIPINELQKSLFFGELISGFMPSSQPQAVETFRVYVPNKYSFAVVVTGDYDVRVISEATSADAVNFGSSRLKQIVIPEPTSGYYLISIRGSGDYSIQVKNP